MDLTRWRRQPDPHAEHVPRYAVFLDQARWLLQQQERRGAAFQQSATALIGFDGVLLAVLVTGDALAGVPRFDFRWWVLVAAAAALVLSAASGVGALIPRATVSVAASDVIEDWRRFSSDGAHQDEVQRFAHMLLSADANTAPVDGRLASVHRWWGERAWRVQPRQALAAAERLATIRGRYTTGAAGLLALGLVLLLAAFAATGTAPESGPTPEVTSSLKQGGNA